MAFFPPQPFHHQERIMQAPETPAGSWTPYVDDNGVAWWLHTGNKPWINQVYDASPANTVPQLHLPLQHQQPPSSQMMCPPITPTPSLSWGMPQMPRMPQMPQMSAMFQPAMSPPAWVGGGVPVPCYVPVIIRTGDSKKKDKKKQKRRSPAWAWESRWDAEKKRRCWKNSVSKRVFYEDPESDCDDD